MARILTSPADLETARQIAESRTPAVAGDRWSLLAAGKTVATVRLDGPRVAVRAEADQEPLEPGEARRLALALLEHADRAEKGS